MIRVFSIGLLALITATVWVPTCAGAQDLSLTNRLDQSVSIWISGNHDPTGRMYDWQPNHRVHVNRVLVSGERGTFANQVWPEYKFVVVEARAVTDTPWDPNAPLLFIRMFIPDQLKAAQWQITVEPGYEQPTWGGPPHDLTVRNDFDFSVFARLYVTDDERVTDGRWPVAWTLGPRESRLVHTVRGQYRFYIVAAEREGEGKHVFIKRFTREQFAATDWTVVIEPGHEKPDW